CVGGVCSRSLCWNCRPSAFGSCPREHPEVWSWVDAHGVRRILDRRGFRSELARQRSRHIRVRGVVFINRGRRCCFRTPVGTGDRKMRTLIAILREVASLFVDDGSLALAILAVVAIAAF